MCCLYILNIYFAYRISLTILAIFVCTILFLNKLKLSKSYLRSIILQENKRIINPWWLAPNILDLGLALIPNDTNP